MYVKYIILNSCLHIFYSYRFSFALVNVQTAQYTMAYLGAGGGARGGGLVTKSRGSFSDFTSHEKQNFIFTIFRNTEAQQSLKPFNDFLDSRTRC
jgi:hypothetical protein